MTEPCGDDDKTGHLRGVIGNICFRARINAFAHRAACESARRTAAQLFAGELFTTLLSILGIIAVYLITSDGELVTLWGLTKTQLSISITFFSICATLASLFISVMSNYLKLEVLAESHAFLVGSYQYIEQRAREASWCGMTHDELVELLKELQRSFQLVKARNIEPKDRHFDIANALYKKLMGDPLTRDDALFSSAHSGEAAAQPQPPAPSTPKDA